LSFKNLFIALLVLALLWWSFKGLDWAALQAQLQYLNYAWLVPIFISTCIGHLARAYRWKLALLHLPESPKIPVKDTFAAVWVAYLVNYATPRLGEATRTGVISKKYQLPFSSVLGTVIADRLWDMLVSLLGFASLVFVAKEAYEFGYLRFLKPLQENAILIYIIILILTGIGVAFYLLRNKIGTFLQGIRSSFDTQQKGLMMAASVIIWISYTVNALWGFYLCNTFGIWTLTDAWVLLMIAALSTLIPTPGGFGSYHAFMIWALTTIWGITKPEAATYALVNHAIQLFFSMLMGAWGFWHFRKIT
jgi:glycosyltransferase 2 family protein